MTKSSKWYLPFRLLDQNYGHISHPISFLLPRSFQRLHPCTWPCATFHNKLVFYGEELLAPCPTLNLEDHTLLAVHNCQFNIFAATLNNWRPSAAQRWVMS